MSEVVINPPDYLDGGPLHFVAGKPDIKGQQYDIFLPGATIHDGFFAAALQACSQSAIDDMERVIAGGSISEGNLKQLMEIADRNAQCALLIANAAIGLRKQRLNPYR